MSGNKLSDLLLIFRTVVDGGSFSAAGRKLHMSPAWVAKQVTQLETQLQATLLIRSTRSLRLTDAGQECYRTAGNVADELAALTDKIQTDTNLVSGTVRINVPSIVAIDLLAPHLAAFQREYPKLRLDITVSDHFVDVLNEDVDIVFRAVRSLSDSTAIAQQIAELPRVLCASQDYLNTAPAIDTLDDLKAHKALVFSGLQKPMMWFLRKDGHEAWVEPKIGFTANNSFVLKRAAVDGAGLAFLPKVIIEAELRDGQLVQLDQFEDASPLNLFLLRAPQSHLSLRVKTAWHYFSRLDK